MRRTLALTGLLSTLLLASMPAWSAEDPTFDTTRRISITGSVGEVDPEVRKEWDASEPEAAVNPTREHMLVTWSADDTRKFAETTDDSEIQLANDEFEIYARMRSGPTGIAVSGGVEIRISTMGPEMETDPVERARYQAFEPSAAYNPDTDEYLIIWRGDDNTAPLVDDEFEIYGRLFDSVDTGYLPKTEQFRITTIGNEAETDPAVRAQSGAFHPVIKHNPVNGGYLLVWLGTDTTFTAASGGTLADGEYEIFGQLLNADGSTNGPIFRISTMGDDNETIDSERVKYNAYKPAVTWNESGQYFVVSWHGDTDTGGLVDDEMEVYARVVLPDGSTPNPALRVSSAGPDADPAYDAVDPDLTVRDTTGETLVVWSQDDNTAPLVEDEFEIHGRIMDSASTFGGAAFRMTTVGDDAAGAATRVAFDAFDPAVAWNPATDIYMLSWRGDSDDAELGDDIFELFIQPFDSTGTPVLQDYRMSTTTTETLTLAERQAHDVKQPFAIAASGSIHHLWLGDGGFGEIVAGEFEVFNIRSATEYASMTSDLVFETRFPVVPAPIAGSITVTNNGGPSIARNVVLLVNNTNEWAITLPDCAVVNADGHCELGDMAPGDTATISFEIDTSHLQLGDDVSTLLAIRTDTDTAIGPEDSSQVQADVGGIIKINGGSGALLALLPLLLILLMFAMRGRRD